MKPELELTKSNFWIIAVNSTASYVLAYLFVFYIDFISKIFLSGNFGFNIGFDWDSIYYYVEPHEWTHDSVRLIFGAGPILILVLGLIALIAFWSLVEEPARLKTFFMWFALHAFNFTFGSLLIGNIFKEGIGHVFNWMYLTDTTKMIVALIGFLGLLGTAYFMSRVAAVSANSYFNRLTENNFPFFVTAQLIVPFILGTGIYLLYFFPQILFQEAYSWITMLLIILFMVMRISKMETIYFDEEPRFFEISRIILITTLVFLITVRILLRNEIYINW